MTHLLCVGADERGAYRGEVSHARGFRGAAAHGHHEGDSGKISVWIDGSE